MPTTGRLAWDQDGQRLYETGVDRGVIYPKNGSSYGNGVAWNGLTAVTERPSGAENNAVYADNMKYLNLKANEEFGITIEAYTYPDEFAECDGSKAAVAGLYINQQTRKPFGFSYRTRIGSDTDGVDHGYKIHIVYNCEAAPSEKNRQTINESPEAIAFSWEVDTTPVQINDYFRPCAHIEIDSTKVTSAQLTWIENKLYGTDAVAAGDGQSAVSAAAPTLPSPSDILTQFGWTAPNS